MKRRSRYAEGSQELEVLVLHVLRRVRRNSLRGEQPIEIACTRRVETELHRCTHERGDEARLDVDLKVDDEIEGTREQQPPKCEQPAPAARFLEDENLIDVRMPAHQ